MIAGKVAFEIFQSLTEHSTDKGSYDRLELHSQRAGHNVVHRAGLPNAPIGVTIEDVLPLEALCTLPRSHVTMSDGVARMAASVPRTQRLSELTPAVRPTDERNAT
jgi:hypothetical protein